jgi:hypothetical protein
MAIGEIPGKKAWPVETFATARKQAELTQRHAHHKPIQGGWQRVG